MRSFKYGVNVVLGAVMDWDPKEKVWTFPNIIERYPGKLVMGEIRAEAAAKIQKSAPLMVVTGGFETHPETREKVSRAKELCKRIVHHGVPREKILAIGEQTESGGTTLGNVKCIVNYLTENPSVLSENNTLGILCPLFQFERARLMFEMDPYFSENNINLDWIIAENILCREDPKRWHEFTEIYNSPQAEVNRNLERKGINDLLNGTYRSK